ncbi:MAG: glycosyltransferase family 2 protein, partial [Hyphomicrobiaceae bacterium]|nr:glycosyltransferase family 2 protein [Hyphomicrobiaceae bacterium]
RRRTLLALSGWDPFNVTEDADLGIRLARRGLRTVVLPSTTWEEAPTALPVWLRQRTRWIKGWMQTWAVHTRRPRRLRRELGLRATIATHAVFGGLIGSALVQPLFYALVAYQAATGTLLAPAESALAAAMLYVCWSNFLCGFAVSMLVGAISVWRRGRRRLALEALLMPLYWLLISAAAYRALYQLFREPFLWEKTPHGAARRGRRPRR